MSTKHANLLAEIDAFLSEFQMGVSYFGKVSVGNSEVVADFGEEICVFGAHVATISSLADSSSVHFRRCASVAKISDNYLAESVTLTLPRSGGVFLCESRNPKNYPLKRTILLTCPQWRTYSHPIPEPTGWETRHDRISIHNDAEPHSRRRSMP